MDGQIMRIARAEIEREAHTAAAMGQAKCPYVDGTAANDVWHEAYARWSAILRPGEGDLG